MTAERNFLSADELLARGRSQERLREAYIPEAGGWVRIKVLSARDRDRMDAGLYDEKGEFRHEDFRARYLSEVLVGEDGAPLYSEEQIRDLAELDARVVERIFKEAQKVNGLMKGEVEEAEKN